MSAANGTLPTEPTISRAAATVISAAGNQSGHGDRGAFGQLHPQVGEAGAFGAGGQLDRGQQLAGGQGGLVQAGQELAAGTRRVVSPRWQTSVAPTAIRNEAGSECGSAKHRLPPRVPTERTRRFATCEIIAGISG